MYKFCVELVCQFVDQQLNKPTKEQSVSSVRTHSKVIWLIQGTGNLGIVDWALDALNLPLNLTPKDVIFFNPTPNKLKAFS